MATERQCSSDWRLNNAGARGTYPWLENRGNSGGTDDRGGPRGGYTVFPIGQDSVELGRGGIRDVNEMMDRSALTTIYMMCRVTPKWMGPRWRDKISCIRANNIWWMSNKDFV